MTDKQAQRYVMANFERLGLHEEITDPALISQPMSDEEYLAWLSELEYED